MTFISKLTSACDPAAKVLLHFLHFKQPLCQSLPREETFSAENKQHIQSYFPFSFIIKHCVEKLQMRVLCLHCVYDMS